MARQTTTLPTNRAAWAWLTGEPERPVLTPATPTEAEGLPAFGRGVELLASAVANTDWYAARYSLDDGVWQRLPQQPRVVEQPDPTSDVWQYRYAAAVDLVEYGNHVSIINSQDVDTDYGYRPASLVPQSPQVVSLLFIPEPGGWVNIYDVATGIERNEWIEDEFVWAIDGRNLKREDVLHISAGNRSGEILGRGAVKQYADALGYALAAERYSAKFFAGGGLPPGIIRYQSQPTPAALTDFKSKWRELSTTGEVIAMPAGAELVPIASDADKSQLVESRTWNAQLTAMILGIPSHLFGLPGTAMTYQNVESADIGWVRDTVDRWAQPIARRFGTSVLLNRGHTLRFDWGSRMRTDLESQANYVQMLRGAGVVTVDEARAIIELPPIVAGDEAPQLPTSAPPTGDDTPGGTDEQPEQTITESDGSVTP